MAIDFPTTPTLGQVVSGFVWDGTGWVSAPAVTAGLPAGSIMAWGTNTPPANWLLCDGSAVSRSTYASLFAIIGTQFGTGDGSTTFNLPDLRGRVAVGKNAGTFGTLGATGGAESATHAHGSSVMTAAAYAGYWKQRTGTSYTTTNSGGLSAPGADTRSATGGISIEGSTDSASTSALQPYQVLNYIIKISAALTPGDSELATRIGVVEGRANILPLSQNYIINGAFDIWQRGTSIPSAGGAVGADMWREYTDTGSGTQSKDAGVQGPPGVVVAPQSYKFTAGGSATNWNIFQIIETLNAANLAGKTVTLSAYMSSSSARNFALSLSYSTGTDTIWTGAWTTIATTQVSVGTSMSRVSATFTVPSAARTLSASVSSGSTNLAAGATVNVVGVQLEEGSTATAFRRNSPSVQSELAACQRYYQRYTNDGSSTYQTVGQGQAQSSTQAHFMIPLLVSMRKTAPDLSYSNVGDWGAHRPGQTITQATSMVTTNGLTSTNMVNIYMIFGADGNYGPNVPCLLSSRGIAGAWIALSAEL